VEAKSRDNAAFSKERKKYRLGQVNKKGANVVKKTWSKEANGGVVGDVS